MTARSIRRAAERKANKLEKKREHALAMATGPKEHTHAEISPAQLAANRANAQFSTGAKTSDGKSKSCLNAVKTGLTGRTVLLPADDAGEYQRRLRAYERELAPVGQLECDLAQSIVDTMWRLKRIPTLEMAIFAQGHIQFADAFEEHDESLQPSMIELQTFLTYEKQLRNLQLQESRLSRRREKETAELRKLQADRKAKEAQAEAPERALIGESSVKRNNTSPQPVPNGFEFSTAARTKPTIEDKLPESVGHAAHAA